MHRKFTVIYIIYAHLQFYFSQKHDFSALGAYAKKYVVLIRYDSTGHMTNPVIVKSNMFILGYWYRILPELRISGSLTYRVLFNEIIAFTRNDHLSSYLYFDI